MTVKRVKLNCRSTTIERPTRDQQVRYVRPIVDEMHHSLIVQTRGNQTLPRFLKVMIVTPAPLPNAQMRILPRDNCVITQFLEEWLMADGTIRQLGKH